MLILLIRWFLSIVTMGAGDEEICDFAFLVAAPWFEYIGYALLAGLKLKEPCCHDMNGLL